MSYPTAYEAIVIALAAGRISHTLTQDEIFRTAREWIYKRSAPEHSTIRLDGSDVPARMVIDWTDPDTGKTYYAATKEPYLIREPGFFGQLVECPYCLSLYVSLALFALFVLLGSTAVWILTPLALWMAATWLAAKVI